MAVIRTGFRIYPRLKKVVNGGPHDGEPLDANNHLCSVTGLPQATMPNPQDSGTYLVLDPACNAPVGSETHTLSPFDHIIVQADWTNTSGDNLGLIGQLSGDPLASGNANSWDGKPVGPLADGVYRLSRPNDDTNVADKYLMWAGGLGYESTGRESLYANVKTFVTNGDTLINNTLLLYVNALWEYAKGETGEINLTITTYKNGTVSRQSNNFTVTGGTQINQFTKKIVVNSTSYGNGAQSIAVLRYNKVTTDVSLQLG